MLSLGWCCASCIGTQAYALGVLDVSRYVSFPYIAATGMLLILLICAGDGSWTMC